MFDTLDPFTTGQLRQVVRALARLSADVDDRERVDQIRLLEELKAAAAAAQASVTADFVASQRAKQVDAGSRAEDVGKGIAAQVGLAKRESAFRARRYVGWAGVLVRELPGTFAALQAGRITEWRAQIVARETAWLSRDHRARVDMELAPRMESLGDRQVESEAKKLAYRLDPHGFLGRSANAEADRRVSLRPAPDTMSLLTGLLPVAQGVSVIAALKQRADSLRASGDDRSRSQIMADTLVERVTGQATAEAVPVQVNLVMTDQSLFNAGQGSAEPAHVQEYGPIPADLARRLARTADQAARLWLRRLYTDPLTGHLAGMESRARSFPEGLGEFLILRDQVCRTPWCDAPVRHKDHVVEVENGGATSEGNGQGLCEACNYAKQATGWWSRPGPGGAGESVQVVTPTGHVYTSRPPDPPGDDGWPRRGDDGRRRSWLGQRSRMECDFAWLLAA